MLLSLLCWNVRGIMSSAYLLSELQDNAMSILHLSLNTNCFSSLRTLWRYISHVTTDSSIYQFLHARCGKGCIPPLLFQNDCINNVSQIETFEIDYITGISLRFRHTHLSYSAFICPQITIQNLTETLRLMCSL